MHRKREHGGVVSEDGGGAVALVHVEVDDRDAARVLVALQDARGDGDVVEDAEALAAIGERMVRASRKIGGDPVVQRGPAAAIVAPTDRRDRSTICGDHGKPMRRWMSGATVPFATAST